MQAILEKFMEKYQVERNPARNTVRAIQNIIPRFLDFCREKGREDINKITREDVIEYLNSLNESRTSTKKTHKAIITLFMNGCYSYGYRVDALGPIAFKGPSDVPRAPMKGFTEQEMKTMRRNLNRLGIRERLIFNLISNRPLRISELADMTVSDVDLENRTLTVFKSKNGKTRTIGIPKEALDDLRDFLKDRSQGEESLFGVSLWTMEMIVKDMIRKLRVNPNGRNSHAFRHTVIMNLLRGARIDVAVVAHMAGNTPKTIYSNYSTHVSIDEQITAEKIYDRLRRNNFGKNKLT